ncbi:unnamed protein product [Schistocephalus solidus]|uniref:Rab-GAP TBC domain-containing protein n=1 Tax=Schistocephalus solidus TaxID=70667 RepID=A0A183SJX2_SCHSO|nr:unnamed protein product [Schistocephalus solidus]
MNTFITRILRSKTTPGLQQICYRFQSRVDVWMRFIWFSRALGRHMSVVRLWDRLLQVHGRTDPRLWAAAAAFHLDQGARAQARSALGQLSVERRALARAKRKVVRLRKVPSCSAESAALRLETKHLQSLRESLGRATRITWDRTLLRGLREARRLLTQGLAFNENSAFLLLELLKCEASAADFFRERVLLRRQQATAEHVVVPSSKRDRSVIRSEQTDRDDATAFAGCKSMALFSVPVEDQLSSSSLAILSLARPITLAFSKAKLWFFCCVWP